MKELNLNSNKPSTVKTNNYNNNLSFLSGLAYRWVGLIEMIFFSERNALKNIDLFDLYQATSSLQIIKESLKRGVSINKLRNNFKELADALINFSEHVENNLYVRYSKEAVESLIETTKLINAKNHRYFDANSSFFNVTVQTNLPPLTTAACQF